jgi:hypothetical protein
MKRSRTPKGRATHRTRLLYVRARFLYLVTSLRLSLIILSSARLSPCMHFLLVRCTHATTTACRRIGAFRGGVCRSSAIVRPSRIPLHPLSSLSLPFAQQHTHPNPYPHLCTSSQRYAPQPHSLPLPCVSHSSPYPCTPFPSVPRLPPPKGQHLTSCHPIRSKRFKGANMSYAFGEARVMAQGTACKLQFCDSGCTVVSQWCSNGVKLLQLPRPRT